MQDEVRVTVIATGFDHGGGSRGESLRSAAPARTRRDRDVTMDDRQRSSLEIGDDEIDIPSFLKDR
jgi:cell division protein FtsZ